MTEIHGVDESAGTTAQDQQAYQRAVDALNRGRWMDAQRLAMDLVRKHPSHAGVSFVAGVAALQLEQVPLALELLKRAVAFNPVRPDYLAQLARAFAMGRFSREATECADRAIALEPTDALTLDTLGVVLTQANAHAKAIKIFRRAVEIMPDRAGYRFNLATSLTFTGDIDEAEREYEACLRLDARYWKAWLALSQLRKQKPDANHLQRLRDKLELAGEDADGRMYLNLAIAKELEDLGEYELSFDHLASGKATRKKTRGYESGQDQLIFDALRTTCEIVPLDVPGSASAEPIFVIGMPRSGTTLVDRILSSHAMVHSAGELQNFGVMVKRASRTQTSRMLDVETAVAAREANWKWLGDAYVASTRPATGHVRHFIDKLPHNFLYAGFIARALPNAKIICLRRDPLDTCLSNFRQLFALTSPYYDYSFDLLDTGRYYIMFDRLMAYWRESMPGRVMEIRYEDLVEKQEACTRQLLSWCGLPWEDVCLRFQDNEAPVATASAVQVRSPMYRSAMQRWKRYGNRMDALRALLERAGIDTGTGAAVSP